MGRTHWSLALCVLLSLSMLGWASASSAQHHTKGSNADLTVAIMNNDTRGALRALKAGADPNMKDEETQLSPLFLIVSPKDKGNLYLTPAVDNPTVVKALLARGAVIDERDKDGGTPLMHAAAVGLARTVQVLLDHGADVNAVDHSGDTILINSVESHNSTVLRLLLHKGARINQVDSYGTTALMVAALNGTFDIVKLLLWAGAQVNARGRNGMTALDYAEQPRGDDGGDPDPTIIKVLKDWGAVHGRKSPPIHG